MGLSSRSALLYTKNKVSPKRRQQSDFNKQSLKEGWLSTLSFSPFLPWSFHGDTLVCQISILYDYAKGQKKKNMKSCQKPYNLTLRSKVNVVSGSWMYATHLLIMIHTCAQYSMSNECQSDNKKMIRTGKTDKQTEWFRIALGFNKNLIKKEHLLLYFYY